jgi:hypothetical protein
MSNEANYFAVLSAAVAQIEADSFEARGTVYDRLWKIVLQRLQTGGNDSEEDVAKERSAFLSAVRRIEFGERLSAADSEAEVVEEVKRQPGRSMLRRIAVRMAGAFVVLGVVWFAYLLIVVRLDSASAERWAGDSTTDSWRSQVMRAALSISSLIERRVTVAPAVSQRAVLYEESAAIPTGSSFGGQAIWRHGLGSTGSGSSGIVLSIDADIPQKKLVAKISLWRVPDAGGAISHMVEFRFLNVDRSASEAVENVVGILMKNDELSRGIELTGKVLRVQRGVFLMGLSGVEADLGRNLKLLKERPWLDIPIVMKDGSRSILAIEKGSTGQNAINQVFASWGQS